MNFVFISPQEIVIVFQSEPQKPDEKKIMRVQYIALATMFVLFFGSAIPAILLFEDDFVKVLRIVLSLALLPTLFIGISSIRNRVSIMRPKGQRQHSTDKQAITVGIIVIIAYVINMALLFSPILEIFIGSSWSGS